MSKQQADLPKSLLELIGKRQTILFLGGTCISTLAHQSRYIP